MTTQREESPSQNSKLDHSRINPLLCLLLLLFLLRNIWVVVCPLDNIWRNWQWKSWRRPGLPRLWSIALNVSVCNVFSFFLLLRPREKYFNDVQHFQLNDSQRWDWYCWWLPDKVKTLTSQRKKKKDRGWSKEFLEYSTGHNWVAFFWFHCAQSNMGLRIDVVILHINYIPMPYVSVLLYREALYM